MTAYVVQRLMGVVITVFFVAITVFLMVRLLPGDPARVIAGVLASEAEVDRLRERLGLDEPLWRQGVIFVSGLARGDLGTSARTSNPVTTEIGARFGATMRLAIVSTVLAVLIGVPLG
ncbi:MAG TPA: ABC transporter permease, partial [Trueperaceae bacterium]|nr:ABC transporter permease [Trueperaceae bacterium]